MLTDETLAALGPAAELLRKVGERMVMVPRHDSDYWTTATIPDPATAWARVVSMGVEASEGTVCPGARWNGYLQSHQWGVENNMLCPCNGTGRVNVTPARPGLWVRVEYTELSRRDHTRCGEYTKCMYFDRDSGEDCHGTGYVLNTWEHHTDAGFVGELGGLLVGRNVGLSTPWTEDGEEFCCWAGADEADDESQGSLGYGATPLLAALDALVTFAGKLVQG